MRLIDVAIHGYDEAERSVTRAPMALSANVESVVRQILEDVRTRGDKAIIELGRRFDCPSLELLEVSNAEWDSACNVVSAESSAAIEAAAANIAAFHEKQKRASWRISRDGKTTGQLLRPLERVGIYVPGGTAVYPSSVLMVGVPARVAGVSEIVMCTPCGRDGQIHPLVLFSAMIAGVSRVFKAGGAQAIAAMAYGTETIPRVDKIAGPGNVYVNAAKKLLWGFVDVDMLAGPSEVCVVADDSANPAFAAADMLTQAEHDVESAAYLITPSRRIAEDTAREIETRLAKLERKDILRQALDNNGAIIVTESIEQAIELANLCAPEHLALMVREPHSILDSIKNAGAILIGDYSPQTLGDYLAGPSHTLPTSGTARFSSPVNVDTFIKKTSIIEYSEEALREAAPTLIHLAGEEGFQAHAEAVLARIPIAEEDSSHAG